jgi:serine/threonine protein kinase
MKEKFASSNFSDFIEIQEIYRSQAGAVYKGKFKYDKKEYVIKERKIPELGKQKDIMSEAKLLMQLDHPNVIQCEGWFRDERRNSIFIVLVMQKPISIL